MTSHKRIMTSHRWKEEASEGAKEAVRIRRRQRQGFQTKAEGRSRQVEGNAKKSSRKGTTELVFIILYISII